MSPELREFVLSLPLDVRRELAKVKEPGWYACRYPTHFAQTLCEESGTVADNDAFLPVSPIAIALHAAKLAGMDRAEFSVSELSGHSRCGVNGPVNPYSEQGDVIAFGGGTEDTRDPTGHRAAIALLQKVMDERKVPNAEP